MLTRRGWSLCAAVAVLAGLGTVLGVVELIIAATAGGALLTAAVVYVSAASVRVEAKRVLRPPRCHAGAGAEVEVTLRNTTPPGGRARNSPTLGVHDPFGSPDQAARRWARFRVAPLQAGQAVSATYQLPGEERGVYELGPLTVRLEDPFGLAAHPLTEAPMTKLVVYPRIEVLDPISPGPGSSRRQVHSIAHNAFVDGDLYALREYHLGDDLRRVHWRTTAKRDEVMIRHDDVPMRKAATVVLDLRQDVHTAASLEAVISAAASVVHTAWRRRWAVRLVTSDGADSGLAAGHAHVEAILERLAVAQAHEDKAPASLTVPAGGWSEDGMVVVVTTAIAPDTQTAAGGNRGRGGSAGVLVVVGEPGAPDLGPATAAGRLVQVGVDQPLAPAWAAAMVTGQRRRVEASPS